MCHSFDKPSLACCSVANVEFSQFPMIQIQGAGNLHLPVRFCDQGTSIKNGFTPESGELIAGTAGTPGNTTLTQGVRAL